MRAWVTNMLQECYKVPKNAERARGCGLFKEKRCGRAWLCGLWNVTTMVTTYWSGKVRVLTLSEKLKFTDAIESGYMLI